MRNTQTVIVLSVVATVLVLGIGACIAVNPLTAIGLAPNTRGHLADHQRHRRWTHRA